MGGSSGGVVEAVVEAARCSRICGARHAEEALLMLVGVAAKL